MAKRERSSSRKTDAGPIQQAPAAGKHTGITGPRETMVSVTSSERRTESLTQAGAGSATANTEADNTPVVLDAVITIAEAAAMKDKLFPHSGRTGVVNIDGSHVAAVDTAGMQVLLAFIHALKMHGAIVRWTGMSEALLGTAQLLGVTRQLGLRN